MVEAVFDEVDVQSTWNIYYTCSLWYGLSNFNAKSEFLSHFHGPLNIENDSADGATVYWGHILVSNKKKYVWGKPKTNSNETLKAWQSWTSAEWLKFVISLITMIGNKNKYLGLTPAFQKTSKSTHGTSANNDENMWNKYQCAIFIRTLKS